jgi:two-component system heavy metal sensor histidine kinase CusS
MSSNRGPEPAARRASSIALRLTAWYVAAAFTLVLTATVYLYFSLVRHLDHEDDHFLDDKVQEIRGVVLSRPGDRAALELEVRVGTSERFLIRVRRKGAVPEVIETNGMDRLLPSSVFPAPDESGERTADYDAADGRPFRLRTWRDAATGTVVEVAMNRAYDDEFLEEFREQLLYVLGGSLIASLVGGHWIARRGVRPIADVTATARRIRPTHLDERIATTGLPSEIQDLADTFNRMLDRLEDSFNRLSRFSADIAHELRTPVNILRGEIEVALGRPRSPEEYGEVLSSCLEECGRLTRIIDSLLFLARAEDPKTELAAAPVPAGEVLRNVAEFYEPAATEAGLRIAVETAGDPVILGDRNLLQQAVGNLVGNAVAHTPAGGTVTVFARSESGNVVLGVRDTGPGIAPQHLPHIFERLYRVDAARASGRGSVGLGLAIVKGIAELHRGTVEAFSPPGAGLTVQLAIPAGARDSVS